MVLDQALTANAPAFPSSSRFEDDSNTQHSVEDLKGDSVVVEKTGFSFEVVEPSARVLARYTKEAGPEADHNYFRRPRAKVYFSWK